MQKTSVTFAMLTAIALLSSPASARQPGKTVSAGGQQCLSWTFAENRNGISSKPQVTFKNKCNRAVSAYICTSTSYASSGRAPCDPKFSAYWSRTFPASDTHVMSTSGGGTQTVVIKECPADYPRLPGGNVSSFPCAK